MSLRQRIAEQEAAQISGHRGGRGGVVGIAGRRTIQLRLVMVEPRDRISGRTPERGQRGGAAGPRQQQVGAGIVAELDDGLAHVEYRHGARGKILFGDRRIVENIRRAIGDHVLQTVLAAVDARQYAGGQRGLERAAHDEALLGTPDQLRAACEIFGMKADPSTGFALICRQHRRRLLCERGREHEARRRCQECTSIDRHESILRAEFLALRCLPVAPESWRAKREALKTRCDSLKTMWLDRPWIYPYDAGHQFLIGRLIREFSP